MFSVPTSSFFFPSVVPFTTRASMPMFIVPAACVRVFFFCQCSSCIRCHNVRSLCRLLCPFFLFPVHQRRLFTTRVFGVNVFCDGRVVVLAVFCFFEYPCRVRLGRCPRSLGAMRHLGSTSGVRATVRAKRADVACIAITPACGSNSPSYRSRYDTYGCH